MLYFAYTARISPSEMARVAPDAEFRFIAHLPEWELVFPFVERSWGGALPTVRPAAGSAVWGAVFWVPDEQFPELDAAEAAERRAAGIVEAMDRTGKRHQVTVHRLASNGNGSHPPSERYLELMVAGSRHWQLPAGWIAGLQEHITGN